MKKQTLNEQVFRIKNMMGLSEQNEMSSPNEEIKQKAADAAQMLSPEEQDILSSYMESNPEGFLNSVKQEVAMEKQEELGEEEEGMSDNEFEARRILHKVIQYVGVGSMLAVVPAAMFISGGLAAGLGVAALAATGLKDSAFFKRGGGHHYTAQDDAERMDQN